MGSALAASLASAKPVLLVRASGNEPDATALAELGLTAVIDPYLEIVAAADAAGAKRLLEKLAGAGAAAGANAWVIATSANGLKFWAELVGSRELVEAFASASARGVRFAAVGKASATRFAKLGVANVFIPSAPYGADLAAEIAALGTADSVALMPSGNLAMETVTKALEAAGWQVSSEVVYETSTISPRPTSADSLANGDFSALLLRSPSAARAVVEYAGATTVPVVCGGTTTAAIARELGLNVARVLDAPSSASAAQAIFEVVGEN